MGKRRHLLEGPHAALEAVGIRAKVVDARHVNVPGRRTDVGDARWFLEMLARAGLLRGSFVPPAKLRELRLIAGSGAEAGRSVRFREEPAAQGAHR